MKKASNTELNTLMNYLAAETTGAMRKDLARNTGSYFIIRNIIYDGLMSKSRITRLTNIVYNTDALGIIKKTCLWF